MGEILRAASSRVVSAFFWLAVVFFAVGADPQRASGQEPIPEEWQSLYDTLEEQITDLDARVMSRWDGSTPPVIFGAETLLANSDRGLSLIRSGTFRLALLEVERLHALGCEAVVLSVHFPWLYQPFHETNDSFLGLADFYKRLAEEIHARGMKVIVETQVAFPQTAQEQIRFRRFYRDLTLPQYIFARAITTETIVTLMEPEFITVLSEPDTESNLTGKTILATTFGATTLSRGIGERLDDIGYTGKVGAGVGTWLNNGPEIALGLLNEPSIDYLSIHSYQITRQLIDRLFLLTALAKGAGKTVAIGESWLHKGTSAELLQGTTIFDIFARNAFSFWSPLDERYLETMVKFAHAEELEFFSAFWSRYFHGNLPYDERTDEVDAETIEELAVITALGEMSNEGNTSIGVRYQELIADE